MNIIIPIAGGIGKCIAGTAFVKAVKKQYPNSKIIVSSPYPSVFKHHPDISETILIDAERNSIFAKYCLLNRFGFRVVGIIRIIINDKYKYFLKTLSLFLKKTHRGTKSKNSEKVRYNSKP